MTFGGLVSGEIIFIGGLRSEALAATQEVLEKIGIHVSKHKHINPTLLDGFSIDDFMINYGINGVSDYHSKTQERIKLTMG